METLTTQRKPCTSANFSPKIQHGQASYRIRTSWYEGNVKSVGSISTSIYLLIRNTDEFAYDVIE